MEIEPILSEKMTEHRSSGDDFALFSRKIDPDTLRIRDL